MVEFTGYNPELEDKRSLWANSLRFDIMSLTCQSDLPPTRGIKELMRRDDQFRMNSCSGFGMTNTGETTYFLQTGKWRQFNPLWSYRRGQEQSNIRGDSGATIDGVVKAAKSIGFLPEDIDGDGKPEYPYKVQYNFPFPDSCRSIASQWKIGYSLYLEGFDQILRFLQTNQGAVIVGGAWGNWRPDSRGICRTFRSGGGGHARAYVDWITIDGEIFLVEANSHGTTYGDNGFSYQSKSFIDQQARDRWTVTIGCSDLKSPEPRVIRWEEELSFIPDSIFDTPNTSVGDIA